MSQYVIEKHPLLALRNGGAGVHEHWHIGITFKLCSCRCAVAVYDSVNIKVLIAYYYIHMESCRGAGVVHYHQVISA